MTQREKVLATSLVVLLGVLGSGLLLFVFVLKPLKEVRERVQRSQAALQEKTNELDLEEAQVASILRVNPRLGLWNEISLSPRDPRWKTAIKPTDEQKRKHITLLQVQYDRYLSNLLRTHRFESVVITPRQLEQRTTTPRGQRQPVYERLGFSVVGRASLTDTVQMLRDFHQTPLLHNLRNLNVDLVPPRMTVAAPPAILAVPGAVPGAAPGAPGAIPGAVPGAVPGAIPGAVPGAIPGRGAFGFGRGRGPGGVTPGTGTLEVKMTIEALVVATAKPRLDLVPVNLTFTPRVLADPGRTYALMNRKNMFTGITPTRRDQEERKLSEKQEDVLRFVKLTGLWREGDSTRWTASLYDQAKGGAELKLSKSPSWRAKFKILDKYEEVALDARVVYIDEKQLVFKADEKFYRLQCGEFIFPAMKKALTRAELRSLGIEDDEAVSAPATESSQ